MLILLSPAKTIDMDKALVVEQKSYPEFSNKAKTLVEILKKYTSSELMELMSISKKLADINVTRFKNWKQVPNEQLMRQAICAFNGDVYTGLNVSDWSLNDFAFGQDHIRILSGLYGVLRPLDYIYPYRLEMGTKLPNSKGENLYQFWNHLITESIQKQLNNQGDNVIINLASNEYFKSIKTKKMDAQLITPVFKNAKNGQYKLVSFFAKKARGLMSRFIVKNQLTEPEQIKEFSLGGYNYNDRLTKGNEWVFTRD